METTKQFVWTLLVLAFGLVCMTQRAFAVETALSTAQTLSVAEPAAQVLHIESPSEDAA